ncbi:hypothetical protein V1478_018143, partial [Vespula squamosa]
GIDFTDVCTPRTIPTFVTRSASPALSFPLSGRTRRGGDESHGILSFDSRTPLGDLPETAPLASALSAKLRGKGKAEEEEEEEEEKDDEKKLNRHSVERLRWRLMRPTDVSRPHRPRKNTS